MKISRRIIVCILAVILLMAPVLQVGAAQSRVQKRYNVVFVTDESGSMKYTDSRKLRYDAIGLFVALMTQHKNYLGSVTFDDTIMASNPLRPIDGFEDKEAFMASISSISPGGDTNIGLALTKALDYLDAAESKENPSVIILLSDGKTDLKPEEAMTESLNMKAEAIERARKAGYQIYTICLNTNGDADPDELRQIAEGTGGQFWEVGDAEDLKGVQAMYYSMIFGSINGEKEELVVGKDGYVEKKFMVPAIGVEELNVILEGSAERYTMTDANGHEFSQEELRKMSMSGSDHVVIKQENPEGGEWSVKVYGKPGTVIDFQLIYNSDFYLTSSMEPASDFKLGQEVSFYAVVNDCNGAVTDPEKYVGFEAQIHLTINGEEQVCDMELAEGGFRYDLTLDTEGTYKAYMTVTDGRYFEKTENTYEVNVNNNAPVYTGEPLTAKAYRWPFIGGQAVVELAGSAQDPDGDPLTYSVESSAYMPEDYTLEGSRLTVDHFSISKGSFTIRAADPYGASCTVPVEISSVNIGLWTAIALLAIALAVLIVIAVTIWKAKLIPFMGTITVSRYDFGAGTESTLTPSRGKIKLAEFGIGTCGFEPDVCFQAGGKDKKIYFKSRKPVYSPAATGPVKKVPITGNGLEVMIYVDSEMEQGICVKFASILNSGFAIDQL